MMLMASGEPERAKMAAKPPIFASVYKDFLAKKPYAIAKNLQESMFQFNVPRLAFVLIMYAYKKLFIAQSLLQSYVIKLMQIREFSFAEHNLNVA